MGSYMRKEDYDRAIKNAEKVCADRQALGLSVRVPLSILALTEQTMRRQLRGLGAIVK